MVIVYNVQLVHIHILVNHFVYRVKNMDYLLVPIKKDVLKHVHLEQNRIFNITYANIAKMDMYHTLGMNNVEYVHK